MIRKVDNQISFRVKSRRIWSMHRTRSLTWAVAKYNSWHRAEIGPRVLSGSWSWSGSGSSSWREGI